MTLPDTTGVTVTDAKRLNDCFADFRDLLASERELESDGYLIQFRPEAPADTVDAENWVHTVIMDQVAERLLSKAIRDGEITLWIATFEKELAVDRMSVKEVGHHTLASGSYQPLNDSGSSLIGRTLWIKRDKWADYLIRIKYARYGRSAGNAGGSYRLWAGAENQCEAWLRTVFENGDRSKSKLTLKAEAQETIDGLSGEAFNRAWAKAAPDFGRDRPGRKSKGSNQ